MLRIGIAGAGRMGCSLAAGLFNKGFEISGIYSRSPGSAAYLNERLGLVLENSLYRTVRESNVIFLTTPDSAIESTAESVKECAGYEEISGKVFFHCSGALTTDVLRPIAEKGGYTGSLHPVQTFADRDESWKGLEGIYFGFEGCSEARKCAGIIVSAFNGSIMEVKKEDKPLYHAAACMLSNYLATLSFYAGNLLECAGIDRTAGINAFIPLMEKTLRNIESMGSLDALTGPVSRGDREVVEGHLKVLKDRNPGVLGVYRTLGRATVEMALKKGSICREDAGRMLEILKDDFIGA